MNSQTLEQEIFDRIQSDHHRMQILNAASSLNLPNWCIAAGFVRNLVWDYLHSFTKNTPINDVDLVYFDEQGPVKKTIRHWKYNWRNWSRVNGR